MRSCEHVAAWGGDGPAMTDAAFEEHFSRFFDPVTGCKRLTCDSRTRIPEEYEETDQWAGVPHTD